MKRFLVATPAGNIACAARDVWHYLSTAKEEAGTLANNQLAAHYVVRICRPGMTFVDVGAHIGSVNSEVSRHCPSVSLVAIEPIPDKALHLRRKFPRAEVHNCALSDRDGEVTFYVDSASSAYSSLARHSLASTAITVEVKRLDQIVTTGVDVIKIDVEGAELGVLQGAEELTKTSRPTIMVESGPTDVLGYTKKALFEWFVTRSYSIFVPNRLPHDGLPLTLDGFIEAHCYPFRTLNYFGVANERVSELQSRAAAHKFSRW